MTADSPFAPHHRVHALTGSTSYFNPWPSAYLPSFAALFQGAWLSRPMHELVGEVDDVEVVEPDWGARKLDKRRRRAQRRAAGAVGDGVGPGADDAICGTWLGHAGAFVEIPLAAPPDSSPSARPPTLKLLFDPIFSARASPVSFLGPKRMRVAPCEVKDLPGVHAVFISHNHYDHLDLATILAVHARWPKTSYFVGLGVKAWFLARGIPAEQVFEMDWWGEADFPASAFLSGSSKRARRTVAVDVGEELVRVTCVPAQHTSGRGIFDQRSTLWCGWIVERLAPAPTTSPYPQPSPSSRSSASSDSAHAQPDDPFSDTHGVDYAQWARLPLGHGANGARNSEKAASLAGKWVRKGAVYHAGDTGYRPITGSTLTNPVFPALGAEYGPFDLAFVPIWRGGTLGFVSALGLRLCQENLPTTTHASPSDAVQIHLAVRSRNTISMHFGTFQGSSLEALEALNELEHSCADKGICDLSDRAEGKRGRMGRVNIGETLVVEVQEQAVGV